MNYKMKCIGILGIFLSLILFNCGDSDRIVQSVMDISGAPLDYDESHANTWLSVASVCLHCATDKETNLRKMENKIENIMFEQPDTRLIVFGETILGWYYYPDDPVVYQRENAETIPGPATDRIAALADSFDVYIVFGLGENLNDTIYNSQVLLNPNGELEAVHRKVTLVKEDEKSGFSAYPKTLDNITVVDIDGIRAGMIVCADVSGYWQTKELVARDIDLVIHSLASSGPEFKIDAVGRQFNAWEIFANRTGDEKECRYTGTCYIADPAGTIRVGGDGGERYVSYRIGVYK